MTGGYSFRGKKIVVVGLGRSGVSATKLLVRAGARVVVTDRQPEDRLRQSIEALKEHPVAFSLGGHPKEVFEGAELMVASPGVPKAVLQEFKIPVISEIELAYRFLDLPIIAITGTNGKSTTTALVGEMIKNCGRKVFVGGNMGVPLCEAVGMQDSLDWIVAEVSSFQLEAIQSFHPKIAALLNVSANHLDRYVGFQEYAEVKRRIFRNQVRGDWSVFNGDDTSLKGMESAMVSRPVIFTRKNRSPNSVGLEGEWLVSNLRGYEKIISSEEIRIRGKHNLENSLAATAIGQLADCPMEAIRKTLRDFAGLEHRFEFVKTANGVSFINDSKATTVVAVSRALESVDRPVVLIAGGKNKGVDFTPLRPLIGQVTRAVVLMGEARQAIQRGLKKTVPVYEALSMKEAVEIASSLAHPGDLVLLSPGCSSFDMFLDFEDRGRQYKQCVSTLV